MNFTQHNLGRGVRLYLCETEKFKSLTCKLFIQQDLQLPEATYTALVPLLLRRGSQSLPSTLAIAREMEFLYSAEIGSDVLKVGERQFLEFYFQMVDPALLPQGDDQLGRGLRAFWEIVTQPRRDESQRGSLRFYEPYYRQEKQTLEQELKGLVNEKRAYAQMRALALMCAKEPFGIYKYGDLETLQTSENTDVFAHYENLITKYPMDIFLVGPNLDGVVRLLTELVQGREQLMELKSSARVQVAEPRFIEETMDLQQTVVVMGYRTNCSYLDPDYYALLVGNGILGGFAHSKLFMNVREKASLAYYVGSSIEGSKGLLTINAGISAEKQDQALRIIKEQVEELQGGQISTEELEQTKRGLITSMMGMNDNPSGIIDRNLIGIVEGQLRTIDQVVAAIEAVDHDAVVRAMGQIQLDTTYVLRSAGQEGARHGAN